MTPKNDKSRPDEPERVVIRDNRKIDRERAADAPAPDAAETDAAPVAEPEPDATALLLEERTRDLQRLQAEYANYRKRADRERLAAGDLAVSRALTDLLPVVDDLDRARAHGDLTGALKAIAEKLDSVFGKLGLVAFGEVGDPFDPEIHEAVMHGESPDVTEPTCTTVMRPGYKHNDRLLRPAMVGVSDPSELVEPAAAEAEPSESSLAESPAEPESLGDHDSDPQAPAAGDPADEN